MATWKVKGVVPDSDDDEELDSQSVIGSQRHGGNVGGNSRITENDVEQFGLEWSQTESGVVYNERTTVFPPEKAVSKSNTDSHGGSLHSSPQRLFKDPRRLFDLDDASGNQILQKTPSSPSAFDLPAEDEISASYVRLTSPMSSPLSSPPESLDSLEQETFEGPISLDNRPIQPNTNPSTSTEAALLAFEPPIDYSGRTFRQRNAIQLHPYIVEQERYRRTLKARGMTPMRLAQIADERSKRSRVISEEPESQEFATEESQAVDIDSTSIPPSSTRSTVNESRGDGEFPDIDELFRDQQLLPPLSELKRRPKQYSSASKQRQLSKSNYQMTQSTHHSNREDSIFDVPASPPQTSSPLPNTARDARNFAPRAISHSPSALEEDELGPRKLNDLLTPATSVVKPVSEPVLIDLASDDEDPFATEPSVSSISSSDESVDIRKISKKFRGVLPASHLRLDQHLKRPKPTSSTHRDSTSAPSAREPIRRGVALPKLSRSSRTPSPTTNRGMPLFSEDSDEVDDAASSTSYILQDNDSIMSDFFSQQRMGIAEEDDSVDAMLPSHKRQDRRAGTHPRKKRRLEGTSLHKHREYRRQVKITEHLVTSRNPELSKRLKNRYSREQSRRSYGDTSGQRKRPTPPRLGILDVVEIDGQGQREIPQFIKLAARAARSKRDFGRQSPSKKFIRLASRNDTYDAQSVLQSWKDGSIMPKDLGYILRERPEASRAPLNPISDNRQTTLRPPIAKTKLQSHSLRTDGRYTSHPRKIVIARSKQSSMNDFITSAPSHRISQNAAQELMSIARKRPEKHHVSAPKLRPAQLELSEPEYSHRYPTASFGSRKKALDNLYRTARKRQAPQSNIQLSRFLANEGSAKPTLDLESLPRADESVSNASIPLKRALHRKRPPQRMDVGAAVYRQPSEPLILELLAPRELHDGHNEGDRLQGLGKFGTRYTIHFDIFPLQAGIFFHDATFIGSGRLLEVIKHPPPHPSGIFRAPITHRLGEKFFEWGSWNEDVSSDLGMCFDWILDRLNEPPVSSTILSVRDDVVRTTTFVIDYVQRHLSFIDMQGQDIFFSRITIIVSEALGRLEQDADGIEESQLQSRIEVTSMWAVLVMQLLRISRSQENQSATSAELEALLVTTARRCIGFLFCKGFETVRKLYDDLQYLSFRANGIKKEQYVVHSWVMIIKILNAAQIPRGSFWDVTNTILLDGTAAELNDARSMEKIWYSIFTLLPLCEFDECGVVIPGQAQEASFDNWLLPQKMLKSVFTLYSSGSRQSPSFNDYCRSLVSRCHYLMTEWGWWKCNGIIGLIFDFFASQNLGHLRNEEVYKSPQFLEGLDAEPSLAVEPDDRCFHIFLKVVALAIKHMREANEGKNIRNLVFRLLPNHDRQYPKEETLDTRDLASLRNHHDLLCTLYWAAPAEQRPSLSLIQELVIADRSHNAACLINLRAWQQLARFVFNWYSTSETFQPFLVWQNTFWLKVLNQFLEEDANTRKQAELLGSELISETRLQDTISRNKTSTVALLRSCINAVGSAIQSATSSDAAMAAFNHRIINSVFNMDDSGCSDLTECLVADTIGILTSYINQIEKLRPRIATLPQSTAPTSGDDSQGSLGISVDVDRQVMIFPLSEEVLPCLRKLTSEILEGRLFPSKEPHFMKTLIETLTRALSLATEESSVLKDFLPGGNCAVFQQRRGCQRANKYWPLFLGELLRYKTIEDLEDIGFDIGLEWMLTLTIPLPEPAYLSRLTLSMFEKKHYLVRPFPSMAAVLRSPCLACGWLSRHLIQGAIDIIRQGSKVLTQFLTWSTNPTSTAPRKDFSYLIREVLNSMQHELKAMEPGSMLHKQYMSFCQGVAEDIRSRGSEIAPLTDFFITPSIYYWPAEGDPKLFAAGMISYSLRLHDQSGRTSWELFHYLYRGWRSDLIHGRLKHHVSYIKKGLKHWSFTEFVLTDFVPAALRVGFHSDFGWILCSNYLPPLASRVSKILEREDSEARVTLDHLATILKSIMNGCMQQYALWQNTIRGIHPLHRGIVTAGCQFWLAVLPSVKGYVDRHSEDSMCIQDVNNALVTFAQETFRAFGNSYEEGWEAAPFDITEGQQIKDTAGVMAADCDKNWTLDQTMEGAMQSRRGVLSIGGYGVRNNEKPTVDLQKLWPCTLQEVLETGLPHFETQSPRLLPGNLHTASMSSHQFLADLIF